MSVVVCGETERIDLLAKYLVHYSTLCDGAELPTSSQAANELIITNKYYTALVRLHSLSLGEDLAVESEGFIVVPSASQADLTSQLYGACHSAVEADVGLRLLVAISDEREQHSEEATRHYEEWAIDNGFEYIEIVAPHITKGHQDREKFGLPRLMEALESNMWSTMQRRTAGSSSSSSSARAAAARGTEIAESAALSVSAGEEVPAVSSPAAQTAEAGAESSVSSAPAEVSQPEPQAAEPAPTAVSDTGAQDEADPDPLAEALADAEDNEILDKYAGFISEVKDVREAAVTGKLSDSARRDQAAAMATKLMQMFALDDDSDSEADA